MLCFCFFGGVSYDNVQKHCILFHDRLIFQSKRCAVILASWCRTLTRWFVSLISPVGNLASEITPFLSLRSSSISCPIGGQSHSGVLGGQPWLGDGWGGSHSPQPPHPLIFIVLKTSLLSLSRSLSGPIRYTGHTVVYEQRTGFCCGVVKQLHICRLIKDCIGFSVNLLVKYWKKCTLTVFWWHIYEQRQRCSLYSVKFCKAVAKLAVAICVCKWESLQ